METKTQQAVNRVYEDFEPYYEWARDEGRFTVMLPGYRKDQLKVQVTSKPTLKLKGERQIVENRWRRFDIEFPIPSDYDLEKVSAKFEGGRLHVNFAKKVINPKEPSQNAAQEGVTPKVKEDKAEARTNNKVSDQKGSDEKEKTRKNKTETEASKTAKTEEANATKAPETKDAKPMTRFKTRLLDFTQNLEPSNQAEDEALEDLDAAPTKRKRLMNCGLLTLLVVGLGLYAKNTFTSSHGGSKFHEL